MSPKNLAVGCPARQSSVYDDLGPDIVVDGDTSGNDARKCNCTQQDPQGWWEVDLGQLVHVHQVKVSHTLSPRLHFVAARQTRCGCQYRHFGRKMQGVTYSERDPVYGFVTSGCSQNGLFPYIVTMHYVILALPKACPFSSADATIQRGTASNIPFAVPRSGTGVTNLRILPWKPTSTRSAYFRAGSWPRRFHSTMT